MKICLAATWNKLWIPNLSDSKYNLESFYYFQDWQVSLIKSSELFLLDSGAFTFMQKCKNNIDWLSYIEKYIDFIIKNDIKYFFELDIDCIVGYEKVKKYREIIERKTGKKCIPVWHKSRGKDEFLRMCDEYDYVAIGGLASKEIKPAEYPFLTWFINEAHKRGCKIHGLGFTRIAELPKYHFDSVDSTSWKSGSRFGQFHLFQNGSIKTLCKKHKRAIDKEIDKHNFNEWVKFQQYADKKL